MRHHEDLQDARRRGIGAGTDDVQAPSVKTRRNGGVECGDPNGTNMDGLVVCSDT